MKIGAVKVYTVWAQYLYIIGISNKHIYIYTYTHLNSQIKTYYIYKHSHIQSRTHIYARTSEDLDLSFLVWYSAYSGGVSNMGCVQLWADFIYI